MNKIYKVIWSKVRNCYVAVSEIAKRNGKSSGVVGGVVVGGASVNCGGKANRRRGLRMTAVTLGVAAALVGGVGFGTPAAWAVEIPITAESTQEERTINSDHSTDFYSLNGSNIEFIVTESGKVNYITGPSGSSSVNIEGNTVQFAGEAVYSVRGGNSGGSCTVSNNTVIISGGTVGEYVCGGESYSGMAGSIDADKGNKVIINGNAEIKKYIYGGNSESTGEVRNNVVTIEPEGTVNDTTDVSSHGIKGGISDKGAATRNEVNIQGKVKALSRSSYRRYQILGAEISSWSGTGEASYNKVTFEAGSSAEIVGTLQVYGAKVQSVRTANNNTVTFKADSVVSVNQLEVYGGYADSGTANYNTVTVNGATITGKATESGTGNLQIIGGYSYYKEANSNNTVNLLGASTIETTGEFTVSGSNETSGTGNELHIGGVKTEESQSPETSSANIWTNNGHSVDSETVSINGINNISNFDSIVLHDVAWNTDQKKPVLYGGTISNVNTLDITNMNIYDGDALKTTFTPGEKMTLLSSGNDISGIKLKHNDSDAESLINNPVTVSKAYTDKVIISDLLKFSGTYNGTVSLATDYKAFVYTTGETSVSSATFSGTADWNTSTPLYSNTSYKFDTTTTINLAGLKFSDTAVTEDPMGKTMTLISGNVQGTVSDQPTDASIAVSLAKNNTTLGGTATGAAAIDGGNLTYTINTVALDSVTVTAAGDTPDVLPTGWTKGSTLTVDTGQTVLDRETSATILSSETAGLFANATFSGINDYNDADHNMHTFASDTAKGVKLDGTQQRGIKASDDGKSLVYAVSDTKKVATVTLGTVTANDPRDMSGSGFDFSGTSKIDASGLTFTNPETVTGSMDLLTNATNLAAGVAVDYGTGKLSHSQDFNKTLENKTVVTATLTGAIDTATAGQVSYTATGTSISKFDLANWDGATASAVPTGWALSSGATIETDGMTVSVEPGKHIDILQSDTDEFFKNAKLNGANVYKEAAFTENENGITLTGSQFKGVTLNSEKKHVIYAAGIKDVATVTLGSVTWQKGATLLDGSSSGYNYAGVAALGTDGFAVSYASPETVVAGDSMTLLQANETLKDMAEQVKKTSYSYTPVEGVTVDANITGKLAAIGGAVMYTAAENQASKLTFGSVDWKDSGALLTRPSNITFAGADVDTTKIHFKNVKELDANKKMTLVSDFGDSVGTITGSKYTVGAGLEGEGAASLSGSDLVFTTKTGVKDLAAQEQTHNTLMVMEAGMAALASGREHLGKAMAGLADPQNAGSDGTGIGASVGGGWDRYETGSYVDANSWNAAVAIGSKRELTKGSLEWGVFGEYGKSNYTLHSDAGRGDGDSHYAGGGLMAKWTNKHDVYTEASVRLGRLSDTANNLLRDATGNSYGYDVHANYFGTHVGIGKIIHYKGGKSLDVYGKYFYTKRDGVDFASGGNNYSLDSVASSILRVGARYGTTDKKWNWYGGLAYEYEFDGKSEGTVDGVGIRAASIKGGSVRGEIGMRMNATKTNPWQTDISIYGYGGKHRGFGGSVNVAYMF